MISSPRVRTAAAAVAVTLAAVAVPVGWWGFENGAQPDQGRFVVMLLTCIHLSLLIAAVTGLRRRPDDPEPWRWLLGALAMTVSYFRFLEQPWIAVVGAAVWFTTPLALLSLLAAPSAAVRRAGPPRGSTAPWWVAFAVVGSVMVATSGPDGLREGAALRAASWSRFDPRIDRWRRQPNPLLVSEADVLTMAAWVLWAGLIIASAVILLRSTRRSWWRLGLVVGAVATIVLGYPQRTASDRFLFDVVPNNGDSLTSLPAMCAGAVAVWVVWDELITPRLARPSALVLQLDAHETVDQIQRRLALVVADPSARVLFARGDEWVDDRGRVVTVPQADRHVVVITRHHEPIAALDLDSATDVAPDLLQQALASLVVSLDAQRLAAIAAAAAADARFAAGRLLDVEREAAVDVSTRIGAGPDRTLAEVEELLELRPLPLAEVQAQLRRALDEVREIAHRSPVADPVTEVTR